LEINDEQMVPASILAVWNALNDPQVLRECIPGCDQMEKVSDTEFRLGMLAVVGPIKARFTGKLLLSDVEAPTRYTLNFEGAGGAAGFGKGLANVELVEEGASQTRLKYAASVQVGGKLAQVGSRLIDGIAKKIATDFFSKFGKLLTVPDQAVIEQSGDAQDLLLSTPTTSSTPILPPDQMTRRPQNPTGQMLKPAVALSILVLIGLLTWYFTTR
jgi:carbon monoxide dehydrogenase subunit G